MARTRHTIDKVLDERALENAMRVLLAIGGSTNAIVHLTAIAGRMGFEVDLDALDPETLDVTEGGPVKWEGGGPEDWPGLSEHPAR